MRGLARARWLPDSRRPGSILLSAVSRPSSGGSRPQPRLSLSCFRGPIFLSEALATIKKSRLISTQALDSSGETSGLPVVTPVRAQTRNSISSSGLSSIWKSTATGAGLSRPFHLGRPLALGSGALVCRRRARSRQRWVVRHRHGCAPYSLFPRTPAPRGPAAGPWRQPDSLVRARARAHARSYHNRHAACGRLERRSASCPLADRSEPPRAEPLVLDPRLTIQIQQKKPRAGLENNFSGSCLAGLSSGDLLVDREYSRANDIRLHDQSLAMPTASRSTRLGFRLPRLPFQPHAGASCVSSVLSFSRRSPGTGS